MEPEDQVGIEMNVPTDSIRVDDTGRPIAWVKDGQVIARILSPPVDQTLTEGE